MNSGVPTNEFDLPAYLLGEIYGSIFEEEKHICWTIEDSQELSEYLKEHHNVEADPQEIYEIMMEFDRQDNSTR